MSGFADALPAGNTQAKTPTTHKNSAMNGYYELEADLNERHDETDRLLSNRPIHPSIQRVL